MITTFMKNYKIKKVEKIYSGRFLHVFTIPEGAFNVTIYGYLVGGGGGGGSGSVSVSFPNPCGGGNYCIVGSGGGGGGSGGIQEFTLENPDKKTFYVEVENSGTPAESDQDGGNTYFKDSDYNIIAQANGGLAGKSPTAYAQGGVGGNGGGGSGLGNTTVGTKGSNGVYTSRACSTVCNSAGAGGTGGALTKKYDIVAGNGGKGGNGVTCSTTPQKGGQGQSGYYYIKLTYNVVNEGD